MIFLTTLFAIWFFADALGLAGAPVVHVAPAREITVRDGDTLRFGRQDYRLHGIDAPEYHQLCKSGSGTDWACGKQARTELATLINGRTLTCEAQTRDQYGRIVAICIDDQQRDIARMMIQRGFAITTGRIFDAPYAADETSAYAAKRGLWQGIFDQPSEWRARHPRAPIANR